MVTWPWTNLRQLVAHLMLRGNWWKFLRVWGWMPFWCQPRKSWTVPHSFSIHWLPRETVMYPGLHYCPRICSSIPVTELYTGTTPPPHHNHFTALFPGPPGWAGASWELLDFMVQGKINRGRHTDHPAGATPSGLSSAHLHHLPHICTLATNDNGQYTINTIMPHWNSLTPPHTTREWKQKRNSSQKLQRQLGQRNQFGIRIHSDIANQCQGSRIPVWSNYETSCYRLQCIKGTRLQPAEHKRSFYLSVLSCMVSKTAKFLLQ